MRYYDDLADQINSACARGTIQCFSPGVSVLPPFRREYLGTSVQASKAIARVMFTMVEGPIVSPPSVAPTEDVAIVTDTVEGVFLVQNESIVVQGWVAAASATPTLRLVANTPEQFESSIKLTPAPNVLMAHPTLNS